ncbi:MAG: HD domain-containing protein [Fluviicola sp.]|nr:HD domain-containing protein [Fluviicola sp.]
MKIVEQVIEKIKSQFEGDATGHDWHHIMRVYNLSRYIQEVEGGDLKIIELAALLHDISDHKLNGGKLDEGGKVAAKILEELGEDEDTISQVKYIIDNVSYKGANTKAEMKTLEGRIVQDADRLDAIGAIGIARTFAYGGNRNRPIYEPEHKAKMHESFEDYFNSKSHTINHFYEKLLLLKDRLNTPTGIKLGEERHQLMENYLDAFFKEWNFNVLQEKE